ncbi:MAG: HEAT repeat domain-containing protein [Planctomycetota bacterium]
MRLCAAVAIVLPAALACSSAPAERETPEAIKNQITQLVELMRHDDRAQFLQHLRLLTQFDSFAVPQLVELLDDQNPRMREGAAFTLGEIANDARVIPALKDHRQDKNEFVRLEVARALLVRGEWSGIPTLIQGLRSEDPAVRMNCNQALRDETLKDFGFATDGSSEEREASIHKWESWWEQAKEEIRS